MKTYSFPGGVPTPLGATHQLTIPGYRIEQPPVLIRVPELSETLGYDVYLNPHFPADAFYFGEWPGLDRRP